MSRRLCALLLTLGVGLAAADAHRLEILTLDEAVARAMTANHGLLGQQYRVDLADLEYERARGVFKPQIRSFASSDARSGAEIGSHYGLVLDRQMTSGGSLGVGYYSSSFGDRNLSEVRFSYRLPFFGGRGDQIRAELDDAHFSSEHEKNRLKVATIVLKQEIARRYYDVMLANDQLQLAEQIVALSVRRLEAMEIRHEGDQASRLELRKATIAQKQSAHRRSNALENQIGTESQLKIAIGVPLSEQILVDDHIAPSAQWSLADLPLAELLTSAERNRLDLALARHELTRLEERIRNERRTLLPNVEVSLQYSLVSEDDTFGGSPSFDEGRFGVGMKMNTDFSRTAQNNERQRKLLELANQHREFARSLELVDMDIRQAQAQVYSRRDELAVAEELVVLAHEEHDRGQLLADGGQLDSIALFELEQRIDEARHQQRAAEIALVSADYELRLAVGEQL